MASPKTTYTKNFVAKAMENPRKALGGHGIPASIINEASERADVFSKLASLSWNSKYRTKYTAGLRASKDFRMVGYKNFANFNVKARTDIEEFVKGLSEADQETFKNNENIVVIVMQKDNEVSEDEIEQIKSGPSLIISFDRAIRADQKSISGSYIMIMYSDSFLNKSEAGKEPAVVTDQSASAQAATLVNKKKYKRKSLNSRLRNVKGKERQLKNRRNQLSLQLQAMAQQRKYMQGFEGDDEIREEWDNDFASLLKKATKNDKTLVKAVMELKKKNAKPALIRTLLKQFDNETLATMLETGQPMNSVDKINKRRKELRDKLYKERQKADIALINLDRAKAAGDKKRAISAKQALNRANKNIAALRAKLGTYKDMSEKAVARKTEMLEKVNQDIEKYILKGNKITDAISKALAKANATEGEKELIKQQVYQEINNGAIAQYAVQQAIQDNVGGYESGSMGVSVAEMIENGII